MHMVDGICTQTEEEDWEICRHVKEEDITPCPHFLEKQL